MPDIQVELLLTSGPGYRVNLLQEDVHTSKDPKPVIHPVHRLGPVLLVLTSYLSITIFREAFREYVLVVLWVFCVLAVLFTSQLERGRKISRHGGDRVGSSKHVCIYRRLTILRGLIDCVEGTIIPRRIFNAKTSSRQR